MEVKADLRLFPDYNISNIRDYLNEEQVQALERLKEAVSALNVDNEEIREWITEPTICRYLRARDWDHDKSFVMMSKSLEWRASYLPHKIKADDVMIELKNTGKMYRNGFDRWRRPVMYMKPGKDNTGPNEREVKVKYLVYLLEKCIQAAKTNDKEKICLILDYKGTSQMSGIANYKVNLEVLNVLQDHYPETLGVCLILNASWSFSTFWSMISPFIHPITKEKVHFLKDFTAITEYVEEDNLELEYGGTNDFQYNFDQHWNKEELDHIPV